MIAPYHFSSLFLPALLFWYSLSLKTSSQCFDTHMTKCGHSTTSENASPALKHHADSEVEFMRSNYSS